MNGNRPPKNGSDETCHSSEKNLAASKSEPIREHYPSGHIHRPSGNRGPKMHEVTLEKPNLDRSGDRAENDACDRSFYQHRIVKRDVSQSVPTLKRTGLCVGNHEDSLAVFSQAV